MRLDFDLMRLGAVQELARNGSPSSGYLQYWQQVQLSRLPAFLFGVGSMVLCGIAWRKAKQKELALCFAALLVQFAFQLYPLILMELRLLGIYRGEMP